MSKPHLVLFPGAWHSPECYSLIIPKLEAAGYTVHATQLPAVGNPNPPKDLSEDIAAIRELVTKAIDKGNDVIVVPHSWSGIVVGSALVGMGKKQREAKGEKGGVVAMGYMCAFIVPEGVSLLNAANNEIPPWYQPKVFCPLSSSLTSTIILTTPGRLYKCSRRKHPLQRHPSL